MSDKPLISFKNVCFSYDETSPGTQNIAQNDAQSGAQVLDDVSFDVASGEFVCIIGRNGSGKSTVAKLTDALIIPNSGTVEIFGLDTRKRENAFSIRSKIGYVFQNPIDQIVNTIVENEVAFGPENLGMESADIRARVDRALAEVDMNEFARCDVNTLSGGQLQRVTLADALALTPEILILDEATSMLDPVARKSFLKLIKKLHADGSTIVSITHSDEEAHLATRIIAFEEGHVIYDGLPCDDVLKKVFPPLPTKSELDTKFPKTHVSDARTETTDDNKRAIIEFQNVSYSYEPIAKKRSLKGSEKLAIHDVSLEIYPGETVAVMGENGSGKSTLIRHMNGLLRADSGRVLVCGIPTANRAGANAARKIVGVCFQYPERQLFAQSVYEDIAYGPANLKLSNEEVDMRVRRAMDDVSLEFDKFAGRNPFKLSGGQQRRVALAGVLALEPSVLVLDEPCASLDAQSHIEFVELIASLRAGGKTIVIVTHDERESDLLADRVFYMKDGQIIQTANHSKV